MDILVATSQEKDFQVAVDVFFLQICISQDGVAANCFSEIPKSSDGQNVAIY